MTQGVVEGFCGLPGQGTAGSIGNGAGDHQRELNSHRFEFGFNGKDSGFGIQGIENGFDHNDVGTTFN